MNVQQFISGSDQDPAAHAGLEPDSALPETVLEVVEESPGVPARARRTLMEIVLDPRSIQWLLASGGVLLTVGIVIFLASLRVFESPQVIASIMGVGTLAMLGGGWMLVLRTRFGLAGRALTLLACLVMPLNLWFYHAQGLLTLQDHLWIAALACCVIYAASARVLKDPALAYVLAGGVAATGLLILADLQMFAQIAAPATLLVTLGVLAIHSERAFPADGPFARNRFGLAFFWSGQALLGGGLALLLGAQVVGWFWGPIFQHSGLLAAPAIATDPALKVLGLVLIVVGAYAYIYSDLVVRRVGWYVYAGAFAILWAEVVSLDVLDLSTSATLLIGIMALTALAINVMQTMLWRSNKLARPIAPLGLFLGILPVLLGVTLHMRATHLEFHRLWPFAITWSYVGAMFLACAACRISADLYRRVDGQNWAAPYLFTSAAALLVGVAGLLTMLGLTGWAQQTPVLMIVPIAYLVAAQLEKDSALRGVWPAVAQAATIAMIVSVLASVLHVTPRVVEPVVGKSINLLMAVFAVEAAIFFAFKSVVSRQEWGIYAACVMACGAIWQMMSFWSLGAEYYTVAFAMIGVAVLVLQRFAGIGAAAGPGQSGVTLAAFRCANAMLLTALASMVLVTLSRLAGGQQARALVMLPAILGGLSMLAAAVVTAPGLRRSYVVLAIIEAAVALVVLQTRLHLSPAQHLEVFSIVMGVILLVAGHIGWYREQREEPSDAVSFGLVFGSLMTGLPLAIAFVVHRFAATISLPDEIALLTVSVLMFVTGMVFRIRATTFVGGGLLAIHLGTILVCTSIRAQLALGVYLAVGGGLLFAIGIVLSMNRDRLLALPRRIRHREGIWRVLAWR